MNCVVFLRHLIIKMDEIDPTSLENLRSDVIESRFEELPEPTPKPKGKGKAKAAAPAVEPPPPPKVDAKAEKAKAAAAERLEKEKEQEQQIKQALLDKILQYRERFKSIKKRNNVSIKSSVEELKDEIHYIQSQLGVPERDDNPASLALIAAMFGLEQLTERHYNPLNLDLGGLGQTTKENIDKFEPLLDELMIKHGKQLALSVEWRLALLLGTTVLTVHSANNGMQWPGKIDAILLDDEVEVADRYEDL